MNLVLFGAPGSGKGTQAQLLSEKFNLLKFSPGESLRMIVAGSIVVEGVTDEEILIIKNTIDKGLFLDKKILNKVISQLISNHKYDGMIFDGYPRDINQYEDFLTFNKKDIDFCFYLKLSLENVLNRIVNRKVCSICSTSVLKDAISCSACKSEDFTTREDDRDRSVIQSRFDKFNNNTIKVYDRFCSDFKSKCHEIDGELSIDEIFLKISNIIKANAKL